ncbi:hypothetical protein ACTA71_011643 [Dictyostelium dimigraforme]
MKFNTQLNIIIIIILIFSNVNLAIKKESNKEIQKNNNKIKNEPIINYYEDNDEFDITIKDCISILVPYGKCTNIKSPFKKCQYKSIFISSNSTSSKTTTSNRNNNKNNKNNNNNNNNQYTIKLFENSKCFESIINKNKNKLFKKFQEDENYYKESKRNELTINCKDKKFNKFNNDEIRVICPTIQQFDSSTSSISINTLAIISLLILIFINKLIN